MIKNFKTITHFADPISYCFIRSDSIIFLNSYNCTCWTKQAYDFTFKTIPFWIVVAKLFYLKVFIIHFYPLLKDSFP